MSLVDDRSKLDTTLRPDGQQKTYLVLSEEERAKGFVRPVRRSYIHVGITGPQHPLRDLTEEEKASGLGSEFAKFEMYPEGSSGTGRFWTQAELDSVDKGCRTRTTMAIALAETALTFPLAPAVSSSGKTERE